MCHSTYVPRISCRMDVSTYTADVLQSLEQVPETGRWRFMDLSPKYEARVRGYIHMTCASGERLNMMQLAEESHQQLLQQFKGKVLPPNHPLTRHIRRVVERILEANNLGILKPFGEQPRVLSSADVWSATGTDDLPPDVGGNLKEWHLFVVDDKSMINAMTSFGELVAKSCRAELSVLTSDIQVTSSCLPAFCL